MKTGRMGPGTRRRSSGAQGRGGPLPFLGQLGAAPYEGPGQPQMASRPVTTRIDWMKTAVYSLFSACSDRHPPLIKVSLLQTHGQ